MEFISTELNKHLLLIDSYFEDPRNNVDFTISELPNITDKFDRKKSILHAIENIEKFHSYFHFEQSFFHTQYAKYLSSIGDVASAIEQYKLGIFQYHINAEAHTGLVELLKANSSEWLEAIEYARKFNVKISSASLDGYKRPYSTYKEYINFATSSSKYFIESLELPSNIYYEDLAVEEYKSAIADISFRHKQYHKNAAIVYLNYFILLLDIKEIEIAKNALKKSKNLDPEVTKDINILSY